MLRKTAALILTMLILSSCGTINPPQMVQTQTNEATASEEIPSEPETESVTDEEQRKKDTFIAEFFDSDISFCDTEELTEGIADSSPFDVQTDNAGGCTDVSLKGRTGEGMIRTMCVDLNSCDLDYDREEILEGFGDYCFEQAGENGDENVTSKSRTVSMVVSKGSYRRYAYTQQTDSMTSVFGYTETCAMIKDNMLTVAAGSFSGTDIMERQAFSQLFSQLEKKLK